MFVWWFKKTFWELLAMLVLPNKLGNLGQRLLEHSTQCQYSSKSLSSSLANCMPMLIHHSISVTLHLTAEISFNSNRINKWYMVYFLMASCWSHLLEEIDHHHVQEDVQHNVKEDVASALCIYIRERLKKNEHLFFLWPYILQNLARWNLERLPLAVNVGQKASFHQPIESQH